MNLGDGWIGTSNGVDGDDWLYLKMTLQKCVSGIAADILVLKCGEPFEVCYGTL
jgi:allantoicase